MRLNEALIKDLKAGKIAIKYTNKEVQEFLPVFEQLGIPHTSLLKGIFNIRYVYKNACGRLIVNSQCHELPSIKIKNILLPDPDRPIAEHKYKPGTFGLVINAYDDSKDIKGCFGKILSEDEIKGKSTIGDAFYDFIILIEGNIWTVKGDFEPIKEQPKYDIGEKVIFDRKEQTVKDIFHNGFRPIYLLDGTENYLWENMLSPLPKPKVVVEPEFKIGEEYEFNDGGDVWVKGKLMAIIDYHSPYVGFTERCAFHPAFYDKIRPIKKKTLNLITATRWMNYNRETGQPTSPDTYESEQSAKIAATMYMCESVQINLKGEWPF